MSDRNDENVNLAQTVYNMMSRVLMERDASFKIMCDGEEQLGAGIIQSMGETRINEPYKVRHHFGNIIGYGYDFTKPNEDNEPTKEIYERAVSHTRERRFGDFGEKLMHDEVLEDKFGLYITTL